MHEVTNELKLEKFHLLGNSMGGHIALLYTLEYPERVRTLTLSGSSGLYEHGMGDTYPRRRDYDYIKTKTEQTFYKPEVATSTNSKNTAARKIRLLVTVNMENRIITAPKMANMSSLISIILLLSLKWNLVY